jgi:short subunit fatty acids transporter
MRSMTEQEMNETMGAGFWSSLGFAVGFIATLVLAAAIASALE